MSSRIRSPPRPRKGLSYILSVIMMTLVITSLSTSVLFWSLGQISDSRNAVSAALGARMDRIQQALIVENVEMVNDTTIRLHIRNTGSVQIVIDQVYVNRSQATTLDPVKLSLAIKAVSSIEVSVSTLPNFVAGNSQLVRASTTRGVSDIDTWEL